MLPTVHKKICVATLNPFQHVNPPVLTGEWGRQIFEIDKYETHIIFKFQNFIVFVDFCINFITNS